MAFDWNFIPILITAASGLGGVWLGGHLTSKREAVREADRVKREASYLAVLVVAHLDRFVNGCVEVSFDDGTDEGQPAGHDGVYHKRTVTAPTFDPLELKVDWKVLPAKLMYGVLNLPYRTEQLEIQIERASVYDVPPDFLSMFQTRQRGYAQLGLEVSALVQKLREHAGLPLDAPAVNTRHRDDTLREQIDKIDKVKAARSAEIATHTYSSKHNS